jgi:hypothetical protein
LAGAGRGDIMHHALEDLRISREGGPFWVTAALQVQSITVLEIKSHLIREENPHGKNKHRSLDDNIEQSRLCLERIFLQK